MFLLFFVSQPLANEYGMMPGVVMIGESVHDLHMCTNEHADEEVIQHHFQQSKDKIEIFLFFFEFVKL